MREIVYKGTTLCYQVTYKKVKNINLRIKTNGDILVSADKNIPLSYLDGFVRSKGDFILKALEKYKQAAWQELSPREIVSGSHILYLGKELEVVIKQGTKDNVVSDDTHLCLTTRYPNDPAKTEKIYKRWVLAQCDVLFHEIAKDTYGSFTKYKVAMPTLKMRDMKSQWGSYNTVKQTITLNAKLLQTPLSFISYVVMHEFCHLVQPNHSKDFYALMTAQMPDWKERKSTMLTP